LGFPIWHRFGTEVLGERHAEAGSAGP
jgi:hypothetical protein